MTYWRFRGIQFSINEGEFPNIHVNWHGQGLFIYVALSRRLKWHRQWGEYDYDPWRRLKRVGA